MTRISSRRPLVFIAIGLALIVLLLVYLLVLVVADLRALARLSYFPAGYKHSTFSFLTDELINPVKFMLLALLLYDGCRNRRRIILAIFTGNSC